MDIGHTLFLHYKKSRHEVTQCFELHGCPERDDDRLKTNGGARGRGKSGRSSARANTAVTILAVGAANTVAGGTDGSSSQQVFSADQRKGSFVT